MTYKIAKWNKRISGPCSVEIEGEAVSNTLFVHRNSNGAAGYSVSDIDTGAEVVTELTREDAIKQALSMLSAEPERYTAAKVAYVAEYGLVANMPPAPKPDPLARKITPELAAIFARTREARAEYKALLDNPPTSEAS